MTSLTALAGIALLAAASGGPTTAQFVSALAGACPDVPTQTRAVSCERDGPASIQFNCRYEMRDADGGWSAHTAILQLAEGEWVWIDGPTRCSDEDAPELN